MSGKRIYVGNIPSDCRERDLEKFFKGYGRIRDIVIKNNYGFVELDSRRDADDAVHDLDGRDMLGGRVKVELAKDPRDSRRERDRRGGRREFGRARAPIRTDYRILVENVSSRTSWQDLKDFFRFAGEISYANAHNPRTGEGIVEFVDRRSVDNALDRKDDLELEGRRLKIRNDCRDDSRSRSRSRSYSRSGSSRSRSRSRSKSRSRSPVRKNRSKDKKGKSRSRSESRSHSGSRSGSGSSSDEKD